jgi:formylglycine-generating enzyme required for sulfatase activity
VMRTGRTEPTANWSATGYRLPTEAEWEKAARGGVSGKRFPLGTDTISHTEANFRKTDYHPSYSAGEQPYTSPVGSFAANGYGLYDTSGNVFEWCWDWHQPNYYPTSNGRADPRGPTSGTSRLYRGGSWVHSLVSARCAYRYNLPPDHSFNDSGFRPARSATPDAIPARKVTPNSTPDAIPARSAIPNTMVQIPGGSFTMGVTSDDTDANAPPITVTVSPFYLQKTETTKAQWDEVRTWGRRNGYTDLAAGDGKASNHPVHSVSWYEVVKWCNARSEKEGLTPVYTMGGAVMRTGTLEPMASWGANGYRLPTEAEWEKAARGGVSGKRYPWGTDEISHAEANYSGSGTSFRNKSFGYHPSYTGGGMPYTSPVESFAANGHGLFGMAGNVREWCWDWYAPSYYTTSNGTTDPRGPASGTDRVFRGGGWTGGSLSARCGYRFYGAPGIKGDLSGFRPARSSVP